MKTVITDDSIKLTADKEPNAVEEYERIFEQYLSICNEAIEKNKGKFPYSEIWKTRQKNLEAENTFRCAVYDDRPKLIYTLQLTDEMKIKIIEKAVATPDDVWPLKYSYLQHVVNNPQKYIDHPATLDWGWMTGIFG